VRGRLISHKIEFVKNLVYVWASVVDYYLNNKDVFDYCITFEQIQEDPVGNISKLLKHMNLSPELVQDGLEALKTHSQVQNKVKMFINMSSLGPLVRRSQENYKIGLKSRANVHCRKCSERCESKSLIAYVI